MFIFQLGVQKEEEITPQLPSADSKTLKSMTCVKSSRSYLAPVAFMFPLSLPDLNKKYKNEMEMDKTNSVTSMEYVIFKLGYPENRGNCSLTSKCRFKNPKIHDLLYVLEFKRRVSCVHVSLILG